MITTDPDGTILSAVMRPIGLVYGVLILNIIFQGWIILK
jgi:hypothetical protein